MTVFNICWVCGGLHSYGYNGCPLAAAEWKRPFSSFDQAIAAHHEDGIVIGDPTNFRSGDFDLGWDLDLEGGLVPIKESSQLKEYEEHWKNRTVVHPRTGYAVKVGSLPSELQGRFKPSNMDDFEGLESGNHTNVAGGVVVNKPLNASDYQSKIREMTFQHDVSNKQTASVYPLFKDGKGVVHLFKLRFDSGDYQQGVKHPYRAQEIVHIGAFKDFGYAKTYALDIVKGS